MMNQTAEFDVGNYLHRAASGSLATPVNDSCDHCQEFYDSAADWDVVGNLSVGELLGNGTFTQAFAPWQIAVLGVMAGLTSLVTVFGNLIVILSFIVERTIRQPTNYFIASLAVSDLLIGSISMPFYTVYLLAGHLWPLGELLCDLWLSLDYTVCLCSIYTVFCITIDRFCSVKIPAKYRNWRTEQKVLVMIALTWVIPILMFFTSIIGWQYFVGERTVPSGMCYVQYMDSAVFNSLLQLGYFWITLFVMCALMLGIYRVALNLQRKSEAKHRKMATLVSVAGKEIGKIGVGMSETQSQQQPQQQHQQHQQQHKQHGEKTIHQQQNTIHTQQDQQRKIPPTTRQLTSNSLLSSDRPLTSSLADGSPTGRRMTSSASYSSSRTNERDDDRSSSVELPSDNDRSSQLSLKIARPGSTRRKQTNEQQRASVSPIETKLKIKRKSLFGTSVLMKLQTPSQAGRLRRLSQALIAGFSSGSGTIASQPLAATDNGETSTAAPTPTFRSIHRVVRGPEVCNSSTEKIENDYHAELEQIVACASKNGGSARILGGISCSNETHQEDGNDRSTLLLKDSTDSRRLCQVIDEEHNSVQVIDEEHNLLAESNNETADNLSRHVFDDVDCKDGVFVSADVCPITWINEDGGMQNSSPVWKRLSHEFFDDDDKKDVSLETSPATQPEVNSRRSTITGTNTFASERSAAATDGGQSSCNLKDQGKNEIERTPAASLVEKSSDDNLNDAVPLDTSVQPNNVFYVSDVADTSSSSPPTLPQQRDVVKLTIDKQQSSERHHRGDIIAVEESQPPLVENNGQAALNTMSNNGNDGAGGGHATMITTTLAAPRSTSIKRQKSSSRQSTRKSTRRNRAARSVGGQKAGIAVSKSENRARKAFRMITILLGAFVLCWTPWHVLSLIIGFCPETCAEINAVKIIYDISYWLCYLNSPINPFCYAFANQQFKKTFLRIIKFDWHRT